MHKPRREVNLQVSAENAALQASKCRAKIRYADKAEAKRSMRRVMREYDGPHCSVYYCPICLGWHLTSIPRQRRNPGERT